MPRAPGSRSDRPDDGSSPLAAHRVSGHHVSVETEANRRAWQRDIARRGYDQISLAYRGDGGDPDPSSAEDTTRYAEWIAELATLIPAPAQVADLGCGAGIPATRELVDRGLRVLGVDFSAVQLNRARRLVPGAHLVQADMGNLQLRTRQS